MFLHISAALCCRTNKVWVLSLGCHVMSNKGHSGRFELDPSSSHPVSCMLFVPNHRHDQPSNGTSTKRDGIFKCFRAVVVVVKSRSRTLTRKRAEKLHKQVHLVRFGILGTILQMWKRISAPPLPPNPPSLSYIFTSFSSPPCACGN